MVYIAIDIGSTYIKSSLLDPACGQISERNRAEVAPRIRQENSLRFEVDMGEILSAVRGILDGYAAGGQKIAGILLSTQMHGFVYTDPQHPEGRYVSWQDARCLEPIDETGK
ncbi:MAG: FGGY family carbohydrate kinase, partial [Clostridia bacterium]|nr:FGGY family carbohydrate kinase [Clostridia bacterium]